MVNQGVRSAVGVTSILAGVYGLILSELRRQVPSKVCDPLPNRKGTLTITVAVLMIAAGVLLVFPQALGSLTRHFEGVHAGIPEGFLSHPGYSALLSCLPYVPFYFFIWRPNTTECSDVDARSKENIPGFLRVCLMCTALFPAMFSFAALTGHRARGAGADEFAGETAVDAG